MYFSRVPVFSNNSVTEEWRKDGHSDTVLT